LKIPDYVSRNSQKEKFILTYLINKTFVQRTNILGIRDTHINDFLLNLQILAETKLNNKLGVISPEFIEEIF
jgi:hypothetical protein